MKPSTIKKVLKATVALTGFLLTTVTLSVASTVLQQIKQVQNSSQVEDLEFLSTPTTITVESMVNPE
jgi:hypothetical protein